MDIMFRIIRNHVKKITYYLKKMCKKSNIEIKMCAKINRVRRKYIN